MSQDLADTECLTVTTTEGMPTMNDNTSSLKRIPIGIWVLGFVSMLMDISS